MSGFELGSHLANFTDSFMHELAEDNGTQANLVVSTYSIYLVLALLLHGARCRTKAQIQHAMFDQQKILGDAVMSAYKTHISQLDMALAVANRLYVLQGYLSSDNTYLSTTSEILDDVVHGVEIFNAERINEMNTWVSNFTHGKVQDLVPKDVASPDTRMVVINAVYFKAAWKSPFNPTWTRNGTFTKADGTTVQVPLMSEDASYKVSRVTISGKHARVLELPFEDKYSMLFMRPGVENDFNPMKLDPSLFATLATTKFGGATRYKVKIPKFKIETEIDLVGVLRRMGVKDLFAKGMADLSGISGDKDLFVPIMKHKAVIEVDEKGAEAAGATVAGILDRSSPPTFLLNRPFFYAIKDSNNTILFAGITLDPTQTSSPIIEITGGNDDDSTAMPSIDESCTQLDPSATPGLIKKDTAQDGSTTEANTFGTGISPTSLWLIVIGVLSAVVLLLLSVLCFYQKSQTKEEPPKLNASPLE